MTDETLQHQISLLLRIGITISGVLMLAGFALAVLYPERIAGADLASGWHLFGELFRTNGTSGFGNPILYLFSGIVVLMLTPIARVVFTVIGFALEKDGRNVSISIVVLAVIGISIALSLTH